VRALGVDYGRKRIGLALSDATGLLARPWKTLTGSGDAAASLASEVRNLASEDDGLGVVVVGLPRRLSGEPNEQTRVVESLVEQLRAFVDVPVELQDERLSSLEAQHHLSRTEKDWRVRKPRLDAMAAAVILQDYLDGRARSSRQLELAGEERDTGEAHLPGRGDR
jgi:putative holliday junction resolvase